MEGLRGYAVLLVLFIHCIGVVCYQHRAINLAEQQAPVWRLVQWHGITDALLITLNMGHYAVDLFFLLSAFLITRIVMRQREFSYLPYLKKRILRIYPAFLLSMAVAMAVQIVLLERYKFSFGMLGANLLFLNGAPIIGYRFVEYNGPTWSLFYEFAFYVVFPLLFALWSHMRHPERPTFIPAAILMLGALVYAHSYMARSAMFFFGMFLGSRTDDELRKVGCRLPTWLVVSLYSAVCLAYATISRNFAWFLPAYAVAVSLLFLKSCYSDGLLNRLFTSLPMRWMGNISYSLYLIHMPTLYILAWLIDFTALGLHPLTSAALFVVAGSICSMAMAVMLFTVAERWYFRRPASVPTPVQATPPPLRLAA